MTFVSDIAVPITDLLNHSDGYEIPKCVDDETFWIKNDARLLITLVFQHLDTKSIGTCSRISKLWSECSWETSVWYSLYQKYFGSSSLINKEDWREEFKREYSNSKIAYLNARANVFWSTESTSQTHSPVICQTYEICFLFNSNRTKPILKEKHLDEHPHSTYIYQNKIFISTYIDDPTIEAFDLVTSELLWTFGAPKYSEFCNLVADETRLYFTCRKKWRMFAIDLNTGKVVWKNSRTNPADHLTLLIDGPLLLYHLSSGRLIAVEKDTGKYHMSTKNGVAVESPITKYDSNYYWTAREQRAHFLCIAGDNIQTFHHIPTSFEWKAFVIHDNVIYASSWRKIEAFKLDLVQQTLSVLWKADLENCTHPIYHKGIVWLLREKEFVGLDACSGVTVYQIKCKLTEEDLLFECFYIHEDILYAITNGDEDDDTEEDEKYNYKVVITTVDTRNGKLSSTAVYMERMNHFGQSVHPNVKLILGYTSSGHGLMLWHK